jgi:hypothetical protein
MLAPTKGLYYQCWGTHGTHGTHSLSLSPSPSLVHFSMLHGAQAYHYGRGFAHSLTHLKGVRVNWNFSLSLESLKEHDSSL